MHTTCIGGGTGDGRSSSAPGTDVDSVAFQAGWNVRYRKGGMIHKLGTERIAITDVFQHTLLADVEKDKHGLRNAPLAHVRDWKVDALSARR